MLQTRKVAFAAGVTAAVTMIAFGTQVQSSLAAQGSKVTPAQKAAKAKDSQRTQQAKNTQRLKISPAQYAIANGTWAIDPLHSRVGFAVSHVLINQVQGTFDDIQGTIIANSNDLSKSSVEFSAKVASINTRVKQRDDHLRSPDFFDAAKYPELTFKSTRIEQLGNDPYAFRVIGVFTMHGVSKTISFPFTVAGPQVDGFGYTRAGVKARFQINRQDYGVRWNQVLDNGGLAVGNVVDVSLDLEAVKAGTGPKKPAA